MRRCLGLQVLEPKGQPTPRKQKTMALRRRGPTGNREPCKCKRKAGEAKRAMKESILWVNHDTSGCSHFLTGWSSIQKGGSFESKLVQTTLLSGSREPGVKGHVGIQIETRGL